MTKTSARVSGFLDKEKIKMETQVTVSDEMMKKYGLDAKPRAINSELMDIFERGVLASVRVSAERFGFSLSLSDLGLVPTRSKAESKIRTQNAIDAVLRSTQRASLLPRDEMWYIDDSGNRLPIPRFENTERSIRMLFPTKYDSSLNSNQEDVSSSSRSSSMINVSSVWAIPMSGMTFIPDSSFVFWKEELDKAVAAHTNVAKIICANYDRLRLASVRHYEQIALDVYNRLRQTAPEQLNNIDPLEFIRRWKRAVYRAWPVQDEILSSFTVDVNYFWAPLPSRIEQDRAVRSQIIEEAVRRKEDRRASDEIASLVAQSQAGQTQALTVSYVRTILERTESVFFNFLNFLNDSNRSPSVTQLAAITKVIEMIRVMGSGLSSFDAIRSQADLIESLIDQHKNISSSTKDKKAVSGLMRQPNSPLPEALANAVSLMREEVESMVGKDGRRTFFTDQNPMELCHQIWDIRDTDSLKSERVVVAEEEINDAFDFVEMEGESSYRNIPAIV